jgi:hypothetical protein
MVALLIDVSKMCTFEPKLGVSDWTGHEAVVVPMVYEAVATAEVVRPDAVASAFTVVEAAMLSAVEYVGELAVGVLPSIV